MIKTPLSTVIGGAFWTPCATIIGSSSQNLTQLIKSIFAVGGQGFAYDPNDLTTMWQDEAKLLPVTGEGQPVWHILDKSGNNNHAFATSSASRPILQRNATTGAYYLAFDGADDFLQTNSIDFTVIDKISLFAGVRKLSDANTGVIAELNTSSLNNSFAMFAPFDSASAGYGMTGSAASRRITIATGPTSPNSAVLRGTVDIAANIVNLFQNSAQAGLSSGSTGTGKLGNYPLYIGRRGGFTYPFNGHIYGLIGIARLTTDSETIALEKYIAKNTGVTLSV